MPTVAAPPIPRSEAGSAARDLAHLDTPAEYAALARGLNCTMYRWMGAQVGRLNGTPGTRFAVWAPNATEVCVISDRTGWRHGRFYLNSSDTGIWSAFMPQVASGETYKFSLRTRWGEVIEKADPYAFAAELPPKTASIVHDLDGYHWNDDDWLHRRRAANWFAEPVSIYEVHLGSWRRPKDGRRYLSYRELAHQLVEYVGEMGYTHIQLMPITEYPFDGSWGYQATGYFAPTSRYGSPDDFRYVVDRCHQHGIGVLIDWVPAHFPTDGHALGRFDGTALFEHEDTRKGFHPDWNTYIYNYGRNEVRSFLLSSARFWCEQYHVDGLRVDAVASMLYLDYSRKHGEWLPNQFGGRENIDAINFLRDLNTTILGEFPGVLMVAEESTAWGGVSRPAYDGGLGFTMKWDMGWMNDTLHYLQRDAIHRKHHQNELSFRMIYAFHENFVLPLSHDEVVHGKRSLLSQMPGDYWQRFANLRLMYGYQYTTPGKPLLFMGGEFGQWTEWNHDAEIDWALLHFDKHDGLRRFLGDLNAVYRREPALHELDFDPAGFSWIHADDAHNSVFAYCRHARQHRESVVVLLNMTPVPRPGYRVGVPAPGFYREIVNSDAKIYGGSDLGNAGGIQSEPIPFHGRPHSIVVTLPPLAMLILKP